MTKHAVRRHRERQERKGLVRVELQVPKEDVARLRELAKRLRNPESAAEARAALQGDSSGPFAEMSLKELLLSAPDFELPDRTTLVSRNRDVEL